MKSQLIGKDPDAGKDWKQKEKRAAEDEMVGWHHRLNEWMNDMNLSKLWEIVKDREVWSAAVYGVTKSRTQLSDWTDLLKRSLHLHCTVLLYLCLLILLLILLFMLLSLFSKWAMCGAGRWRTYNQWGKVKPPQVLATMKSIFSYLDWFLGYFIISKAEMCLLNK